LRSCDRATSRFPRLHTSSNQISQSLRIDALDSGFRFHIPRAIS
jgi:hypothetical protein